MSDTCDDIMASYQNHQKALAEANAINKSAVFNALATAGITSVTVTFNGEGDSGQIEEVAPFAKGEPAKLSSAAIQIRCAKYGAEEATTRAVSLAQAIEDLCYDYLSQEQGGWENNDGAYGDFTFHVHERRIELEFNARFSDSTLFNYSF